MKSIHLSTELMSAGSSEYLFHCAYGMALALEPMGVSVSGPEPVNYLLNDQIGSPMSISTLT
jgi:hypothetical protein